MIAPRSLVVGSLVLLCVLTGALFYSQTPPNHPQLVVYCAAGVRPVMEDLRAQFLEEHGIEIVARYAGSGELLGLLKTKMGGDLFLAADASYIEEATKAGLIHSSFSLGRIRAVIAVAPGNPKNIQSVDDLLAGDIRFAIAEPDVASIGRQTRRLLRLSGHWDQIRKAAKVIQPTVNKVAETVKLDTVDAAIIWNTTTRLYGLEAVRVKEFDASPQEVTIGVLSTSESEDKAKLFAEFLRSEKFGRPRFRKAGYEVGARDRVRP